jgi:dTMP kinase
MGLLITFEGGEFVGKTSVVVPGVLKVLQTAGLNTKSSREPGGTPRGEEIRKEIFEKVADKNTTAEDLAELFFRARKIHLEDVIFPFTGRDREKDGVMLLDRYFDSTVVLQGMEGGVDKQQLLRLIKESAFDFYPDLTVILYFPEEQFDKVFNLRKDFAAKNSGRLDNTEWDKGDASVQLKRQKFYLSLPEFYKELNIERTFAIVDASQHPRDVIKDCLRVLAPLFDEQYTSQDLLNFFESLNSENAWYELDRVWNSQQQI